MTQNTITDSFSIQGVGLHTGSKVNIKVRPAPEKHGIKFIRTDLEGHPSILAEVAFVSSTDRGTSLEQSGNVVHTVEHIMSALYGMNIQNVAIEIDGPEVPILDGSAKPYVEAIQRVGVTEQEAEKQEFVITETICIRDEETGAEIMAIPYDGFSVTVMIDYDTEVLGQQYAQMDSMSKYPEGIAPNRTFVFTHELEYLLSQGLIKGGDLENALVIADGKTPMDKMAELAGKLNKSGVDLKEKGVLNNTDLLFENEPARHKLLDLIGDVALLGKQIKGKIIAKKPGHGINVTFTKELKKHYLKAKKLKGMPHYDPTIPPVKDINDIKKMLPHRHPFLLVDKIVEINESYIVGVKNITGDEYFFPGHFPDNPIFPGVLQMEALAQTGGVLALSKMQKEGEKWDTYFLKMDNVKFKSMVVPGDTMIMKMELMAPIRRGIITMKGTIYVSNRIVSEGELTAQIVKSS